MNSPDSDVLNALPLNFFEHLFNAVVITTASLEADHPKILYVNPAFTEMTGYASEEILGKTPRVLQGDLTDRNVLEQLKKDLLNDRPFEGETFNYRKNGSKYRVRWNIEPVRDARGDVVAYISFQKDVTTEYALMQHRKLFQKAIDQSSVHIALFDEEGHYIYANRAYVERTGYTLEELMGTKPKLLQSGLHSDTFYTELRHQLDEGESFAALFTNKNALGSIYYEKQTITPIKEEGKIIGYVVFGKSYDDELNERNELLTESMTDALTGLFNRKGLENELERAILQYHRHSVPFCLLFADLNDFKIINDRYGHDTGDEVLRRVASVLLANVRKSDCIVRYGGDEFIAVLSDIDTGRAELVVDKIRKALASDEGLERYRVGISIGIAAYEGEELERLIKKADEDMYRRKAALKQPPA